MKVIRQKSPGIHRQGLRFSQPDYPLDAILPLGVSLKDPLTLNPPRYHLGQHTGGIHSGSMRPSAGLTIPPISLPRPLDRLALIPYDAPIFPQKSICMPDLIPLHSSSLEFLGVKTELAVPIRRRRLAC